MRLPALSAHRALLASAAGAISAHRALSAYRALLASAAGAVLPPAFSAQSSLGVGTCALTLSLFDSVPFTHTKDKSNQRESYTLRKPTPPSPALFYSNSPELSLLPPSSLLTVIGSRSSLCYHQLSLLRAILESISCHQQQVN